MELIKLKYLCPYYDYFRKYNTNTNWNVCPHCGYCHESKAQPKEYKAIPKAVENCIGKNVTTHIKKYGHVKAHVVGYNPDTEMVSLILLMPSGQNYIKVHYKDIIEITIDFEVQGNWEQKNKSYDDYYCDDNDCDDERQNNPQELRSKKIPKAPQMLCPYTQDFLGDYPYRYNYEINEEHHDNFEQKDSQRREGWYPPRYDEYGYHPGGWLNKDGWNREQIGENSDEWLSLDKLQEDSENTSS